MKHIRNFIGTLIIIIVFLGYQIYCHMRTKSLFLHPEKSLVVVIPSYNNALWYKKNLASVFSQQYSNYRVIYIDDCSTDKTGDLVENYIHDQQQTHRVQLIRNSERKGVLANIYTAVHSCKNDEIIIDLDGDDWLKNNLVFKKINAHYQDSSIWLTYGQYETYPVGNKGICRELPSYVIENNRYRFYPWVTSHLRTFYAGLFKLIRYEDFFYLHDFYKESNDQLFMFCMLEMAGEHSLFVPDVLYVYNTINSLNEFRINHMKEEKAQRHIREKNVYAQLPDEAVSSWFEWDIKKG